MKALKTFFSSFRNAVLSVVSAIIVLAIVGTGLTLAVQSREGKTLIDRNAALEYALADAGVDSSEITIMKQKLDRESGNEHYEIAFYTDSYAYEYKINAVTGAVQGVDIEALFGRPAADGSATQPDESQSGQENSGNSEEQKSASDIGLNRAKEIALDDAGLTASDVTFTEAKSDLKHGVPVYELEFVASSVEYEYKIDAATGAVVDKSVEIPHNNGDSVGVGNLGSGETFAGDKSFVTDIGLDQAKEIAVGNAGLQLSDVTFTKARQDWDDGVAKYELEFYTSSAEYEYEILAATGDILESEVKGFQGTSADSGTSLSYIGVDLAKEIALQHAGCEASEVVFTKAKLEKDDGCMLYELEFCKGNGEYEYCIEAFTGSILDWEYDCDSDCSDNWESGHHSNHH